MTALHAVDPVSITGSSTINFFENMYSEKDNTLLKFYKKGWKDELHGTTSVIENNAEIIAYKLGAEHCITGDDKRSVDEILEMIHKKLTL